MEEWCLLYFKHYKLVPISLPLLSMQIIIKRTTTQRHLYPPNDYSGSPTTSIYTEWSKKAAEAYLTTGWGEGAITEFNLDYLYGPEPEVSGE